VDDIDGHKRAEEALRKSEAQLQAIFDAVPVGIMLADASSGRVSMANPEAKRILGDGSLDGLTVGSYGGAIRANGRRIESTEYPLARALRGERTEVAEAVCQRGDGTEVEVSLVGAPIFGADGQVDGGVLVIQERPAGKPYQQETCVKRA
jgi:PAS domain S-box-containing protein